jgi:hypothetical protein
MKCVPSAIVGRESRPSIDFEQQDLDAWSVLTESGPVLDIGTVVLTPSAWQLIPKLAVWMAIDLHECGNFGRVCPETWARNEEAVLYGRSVCSLWQPANRPEFRVITDRCASRITTTVSVS